MSLMQKQFCTFPEDKAAARVAVAQDVIDQIRAKAMVAADARGFVVPVPGRDFLSAAPDFIGISTNCTVCALGGALLSAFRLFDGEGFAVLQAADGRAAHRYSIQFQLQELFTPSQLRLIEAAFEGWPGWDDGTLVFGSFAYAERYDDPNERLIAIMQNVVDNGGQFIHDPKALEVA